MKNKKIAITGGIGSGKSTVCEILLELGYPVISCDKITTELYQKRKIKLLLKKIFPHAVKGFFNPKIDRAKISASAFNDKALHVRLTQTITPLVMREVERKSKKFSGTVFVEVPILFECNYQNYFDAVLVIKRDKTARIESVKARSNLSEQQVLERISNQVDYDSLDLSNYTLIINDDLNTLKDKVLSAINLLISD